MVQCSIRKRQPNNRRGGEDVYTKGLNGSNITSYRSSHLKRKAASILHSIETIITSDKVIKQCFLEKSTSFFASFTPSSFFHLPHYHFFSSSSLSSHMHIISFVPGVTCTQRGDVLQLPRYHELSNSILVYE